MKGISRLAPSGIVLALGALVAWLALPGGVQAQYPPPTGSITLSTTDATPPVGESVVVSIDVIDETGAPIDGVSCTFAIAQQPGTDATVEAGPVITDAAGKAETTLSVGSEPGLIAVEAQCGELSALTSVVAGTGTAAGTGTPAGTGTATEQPTALPATGDGTMASSGGAFSWQLVLLAGAGMALAGLGIRRVIVSRRSS